MLRSCVLVLVVLSFFLLPTLYGVIALVLFALVQAGFYFYVQRLVFCIFTLAQRAEGEGQPVGRPPNPPGF